MSILLYITKVFIASGILFGYYWLFLRNKKFHHYNRFYLLAALIIPPVISFISIPVFSDPGNTAKEALYQTITTLSAEPLHQNNSVTEQTSSSGLGWKALLMPVYLLVSMALLFILLRTIFYILKLRRKYPFEAINELKIYDTSEPGTPFSFFQSIFWNRELVLESKEGQQIFRHELFHVQQKHSADILLVEILSTVFWINPFYHLIKKELRAIHEFLADQYAVKNDDSTEYAQLLLQTILKASTLSGTNYFFQNHIKRRIAMITQLKKRKYSYWSRLMVLPVTVLLFCGIALYAGQSPTQKTKADPVPAENSLKNIIVDTIPIEERKKLESELKELQVKKLKMMKDQQKELQIINQKQQLLLERMGEETEHRESTLKKQMELLNEQEMLERNLLAQLMEKRKLAEIEALNQKLQFQEKHIGKEKLIELQNLKLQLQKEQGEQVQKDKYGQEKIQLLKEKELGQMKQKTLDNQTAELLDKIGKQKMEELQFQQLKTVQLQILIEQKERLIMESNKNAQKKLLKLYKEKISRQNEDEIINKKDIEATKEDTVRISPDEFEKLFADNLSKKLNFETFETSFAFGNVYLKIKDDPKVYYIIQAEFTALKKKNNSIPWEKEYDKIFTKVEIESQFPGGENPWKRYLDNNIKNPIDASGKKMQGLVELQFIIDKEGNIIHYRVIGGNSVLQEEAIRLLTKSGQWTRAVQNGHKVKAYKKQVIVFGDVTKEEIEKANESTTSTINN